MLFGKSGYSRHFDASDLPAGLFRWLRPRRLDYRAAFLAKQIVPGRYKNVRPVARYRRYIERNGFEGRVALGVQLKDADHATIIDHNYARGFFAETLEQGDTTEVTVRMRAPQRAGVYGLEFDMVDEYVAWFGANGSPTMLEYVNVRDVGTPVDTRTPDVLGARLQVIGCPRPGVLRVLAENVGNTVWLAKPLTHGGHVCLGAQRLDAEGNLVDRDWLRVELPHCVAPGQDAQMEIDVSNERHESGTGSIKLDLVCEAVSWFEDRGSEPLLVAPADFATDQGHWSK